MGKIRAPHYRIVVADSRTKRDGRVIEEIGKYHPKEEPSFIEVNSERAQYWLGVGAQPSEPVAAILKITGDWQQFKGEAAPAPMRVAEPRRDRTDIFNEALKDAATEPKGDAVTKKSAKKAAPGDEKPAKDAAPADAPAITPSKKAKPKAEAKPEAKTAEAKTEEAPAAEAPAETPAEAPAEVPASETPEGAADEAEAAETKTEPGN